MKKLIFISRHPVLGFLFGCVIFIGIALLTGIMPVRVAAEIAGLLTIAGADAQVIVGRKRP